MLPSTKIRKTTKTSSDNNGGEKRPRRHQIPFLLTGADHARAAEWLRRESTSGVLLLAAIIAAMIAANSPLSQIYLAVRDYEFGPASLHLHLSVGAWASDALLAIYFFLVGLELKRELKVGALRSPKRAFVPTISAFGGAMVPALIFLVAVRLQLPYVQGWAIPTATDIAIAVTLLGLFAPKIPAGLRLFLLTLATVDDLIAIVVIAIVYTESMNWLPLGLAVLVICGYRLVAVRYRQTFLQSTFAAWLVLLPIGIVAWALVHASGIHATVAGVVLGFMIPVGARTAQPVAGGPAQSPLSNPPVLPVTEADAELSHPQDRDLSTEFEHRFRPIASGLALPLFAFFSAGVPLSGWTGIAESASSPLFLAIFLGLVLGKPVGITVTAWLAQKITRGELADGLKWIDMIGMGCLAGVGFTMSILISELSFAADSVNMDHAKFAVLAASTTAALVGTAILGPCSRNYAK